MGLTQLQIWQFHTFILYWKLQNPNPEYNPLYYKSIQIQLCYCLSCMKITFCFTIQQSVWHEILLPLPGHLSTHFRGLPKSCWMRDKASAEAAEPNVKTATTPPRGSLSRANLHHHTTTPTGPQLGRSLEASDMGGQEVAQPCCKWNQSPTSHIRGLKDQRSWASGGVGQQRKSPELSQEEPSTQKAFPRSLQYRSLTEEARGCLLLPPLVNSHSSVFPVVSLDVLYVISDLPLEVHSSLCHWPNTLSHFLPIYSTTFLSTFTFWWSFAFLSHCVLYKNPYSYVFGALFLYLWGLF